VLFALMSIINPLIGASYLVYTLAIAVFLVGVGNIALAFGLRNVKSHVKHLKEEVKEKLS